LVLTGLANGKNLKAMNREDQERLQHAEGASPRPVFGSDLTARQVIHSNSDPSETRLLKEKELGKAEISDEGCRRLFYKDANDAKYIISKY
jgi:hypothetical protein